MSQIVKWYFYLDFFFFGLETFQNYFFYNSLVVRGGEVAEEARWMSG